jgi:hypothetical protein
MATPLVGVTPIFAVSFWAYDLGKKIVYAATPNRASQTLSIPELAFAGFFSAVPTTLLMSPSERIKVVLQVKYKKTKSGGLWDKMKNTLSMCLYLCTCLMVGIRMRNLAHLPSHSLFDKKTTDPRLRGQQAVQWTR